MGNGFFVPWDIWYLDIDYVEALILADIVETQRTGQTYGKYNAEIAKHCKCSIGKVTKAIHVLIDLGYVRLKSFDGRTRVLEATITVNE